jgi:hypothetical protein
LPFDFLGLVREPKLVLAIFGFELNDLEICRLFVTGSDAFDVVQFDDFSRLLLFFVVFIGKDLERR